MYIHASSWLWNTIFFWLEMAIAFDMLGVIKDFHISHEKTSRMVHVQQYLDVWLKLTLDLLFKSFNIEVEVSNWHQNIWPCPLINLTIIWYWPLTYFCQNFINGHESFRGISGLSYFTCVTYYRVYYTYLWSL